MADTDNRVARHRADGASSVHEHEGWNFKVLVLQGTAIDLNRVFASPKLVLPYLYIALGAPVVFAGLLIPIVQVARMLTQLVAAPRISSAVARKWFMVFGIIITIAALAVIAIAAEQEQTIFLALLFLVVAGVLGIGQGLNSLALQTMLRHIMTRERQNRLLLYQQFIGGILAIAIAAGSVFWFDFGDSLTSHISLLWIGIGAALVATIVTMAVREYYGARDTAAAKDMPSEPAEPPSPSPHLLHGFGLLRRLKWFRQFCILRCLLLSVELAMPFYAIHAALPLGAKAGTLHAFVIASSLGMVMSGIIWRNQARWPLRYSIFASALIAASAAVAAVLIELTSGGTVDYLWHVVVFFLIALAAKGTNVARQVYLLSASSKADAAYHVSVSNAITGVVAIVFAFILGVLAHVGHAIWPILILLSLNLVTAVYALSLPSEHHAAAETP
ncbi:MAG: MFS transporter [Pseudomonadota bacterium]